MSILDYFHGMIEVGENPDRNLVMVRGGSSKYIFAPPSPLGIIFEEKLSLINVSEFLTFS